jgi:SpoVK/Ycf46/Vps4 family AAA+-type ATPase
MLSSEQEFKEMEAIVDEILEKVSEIISEKFFKANCVKIYHEEMMKALEEVLNVFDKPKPRTNFEDVIETWKNDFPAKQSPPDTLITPKFHIRNEIN